MKVLFAVLQVAAAAALGIMVIIVMIEIVMRYAIGPTYQLSPEFAGYALVAMTFFGMAGTYRGNHLMRIEMLYERWSQTTRRALSVLFETVALCAALIVAWYSWNFALTSFTRGTVAPTLYSTPLWIPQMMIPLGSALLALAIAIRLVRVLRGREDV